MGNPVVHWELWSKNPEGISKFYQEVFDWKIQHNEQLAYTMVETGGEGGINGGIMTPQEGPWPGNMAFYVMVDDLAAFRSKIVDAGGEIVVEQMEIPGAGALSLFRDPDGRVMGIWKMS